MTSSINNLSILSNSLSIILGKGSDSKSALINASDALYDLHKRLKLENHTTEEWSEIYEIIHPYKDVDFTIKEKKLFETIKDIFKKVIYPDLHTAINEMLEFVRAKRTALIHEEYALEKIRIENEWKVYPIDKVHVSDLNALRSLILSKRAEKPRIYISLEEELIIIKSAHPLLEPALKGIYVH